MSEIGELNYELKEINCQTFTGFWEKVQKSFHNKILEKKSFLGSCYA